MDGFFSFICTNLSSYEVPSSKRIMKSISGEIRSYLKDKSKENNENICIFAQDSLQNFDQKALNNYLNIEDNERLKKKKDTQINILPTI